MSQHPGRVRWVAKGWGGEQVLVNNDLYCGKRLFLVAGHRLSWHYHERKDETFYVQSGRCRLYHLPPDHPLGNNLDYADVVELTQGQTFHVPPGTRHRLEALEDTWVIEISTRDDPEDSIRILKGD